MLVKPIGPLEVNDLDSKFTIIFEKYTIQIVKLIENTMILDVRGTHWMSQF